MVEMKNVEYYMGLNYKMIVVQDEEGLCTAYFPNLPGCITCADTLEEVTKNAVDAKRSWFEAALKDGVSIMEPSDSCYSQVG